jgi:hypothetical protein
MGQGYPWPVGSPLESPVSGEETPWGDKIKKKKNKKQKTIDKVGIARLNKSVFFFFFFTCCVIVCRLHKAPPNTNCLARDAFLWGKI